MTYAFKNAPSISKSNGNIVIASAIDGLVYTESSRLHVKGKNMHFVYKPDGSPVGWYARNPKTFDDVYLGEGACPTIELENAEVKNTSVWSAIKQEPPAETEKE